jgi:8-amino-7-oxononanoate synthase
MDPKKKLAGTLQQRLAQARKARAVGDADEVQASGVGQALRPGSWIDEHPAVQKLNLQKAALAKAGVPLPYGRPHESLNTNTIQIGGREMLNFSGYNYLGLSGHPEVAAAAKAAIDRYGTSVSASRLASGEIPLHAALEQELAVALGAEACLVFVSGYGTNVSTLGHLFGPNDLVIHDSLAHNSIVVGAQLSGALRVQFPHNDVNALDRLLLEHRHRYERAVIVVEGVYSMDGDIAPMDKLVSVKKRHGAVLMVDEAHSLGVLGEQGLGVKEHFGLLPEDVDVWMGTLSKSLASCGGYIAGSAKMVEFLRHSAPGFIYSVGLSPPDTAAALAALRVLRREPERIRRLQSRSAQFVSYATARGLKTGMSAGSAVVPIILADSLLAMRLADVLFQQGIHVHPIVYPAVAEDAARLRFFISAEHTQEELQRAVDEVCVQLRKLAMENPGPTSPIRPLKSVFAANS